MVDGTRSDAARELGDRLEELGRELGRREAEVRGGLEEARACAEKLRAEIAQALDRFHAAAAEAGAPHLRVALSETRVDDKHVRSVQFELQRGRHRAIVTAKSRGDLTLVGPFHVGKQEGPCLSFPQDAEEELRPALLDFLERFLQAAATP